MVEATSWRSVKGDARRGRAGWAVFLSTLPFLSAYTVFPLTIVAAIQGGWWVVLPFWTTIAVLDFIFGENHHNPDISTSKSSLLFSDVIVWLWVPTQAVMYAVVFHQFFYSDHLAGWEKAFVLFAAGRATALGLTVGHELSHRRSRWEKGLGEIVMSFAGIGYYSTEHVYIHHTYVATPRDHATARKGENIYRFMLRSWIGTIAKSWRFDRERFRRRGRSMWHPQNPWWRYLAVLVLFSVIAATAAALSPLDVSGWHGLAFYAGIILIANTNLRGVDYIEHYGLLRTYVGKGRFEPTKPRHSWNAAERISSYVMFNVQRHSDHHHNASRPYPLLQTYEDDQAHKMPSNYVTMFMIALFPPLWRRIMHPRLEAWRRQFYPEITDWAAYESPLFHRYPEKFPIIEEVMANDARLSEWMHRHPAVLEGKHTPEQAYLSLPDTDFEDEWKDIGVRGLVNVFYRKELTPQELEEQISDLTQGSESVVDAATAIRPWLEDRSFQLALHRMRGHLDPEAANAAFSAIVDATVLHLAGVVDSEIIDEFDEPAAGDAPEVFALGPLARSELEVGDALALAVEPGAGEGTVRSGADLRRFHDDWTKCLDRGLRQLFHNDFPCGFAGMSADLAEKTETDRRRLRP